MTGSYTKYWTVGTSETGSFTRHGKLGEACDEARNWSLDPGVAPTTPVCVWLGMPDGLVYDPEAVFVNGHRVN